MKKLLSVLLVIALGAAMLAGCAAPEGPVAQTPEAPAVEAPAQPAPEQTPAAPEEPATESVTVRLGGLKGATSIGMVKLLDDAAKGLSENSYEYTLAGSADELTPLLIKGELDVIAAPVNLASVLYNKTEGKVQLAALNTLGVLYIVEKGESVQSIADLKGKTIFATGKGSTPEYNLAYLLSQNGLDMATDVTMEWKSEPTETVAAMAQLDEAVAMLPQPYVTVAQGQLEGLRVALDLTKEWDELHNGSMLITAGLIVNRAFAEAHPAELATFLAEYKASAEFANTNVEETAVLVEELGIIKAAVAQKAIPFCNIVYIDGAEMKTALGGYLQILYDQKPEAVGGALPGDDFYYGQ